MPVGGRTWSPISMLAGVILAATTIIVAICIFEATRTAAPPHSNVRVHDGAVRIHAIASGDVLDEAGLEPGDVIDSINGIEFATGGDYAGFFRSVRPGDVLSFSIRRDGQIQHLKVTARPNASIARFSVALTPIVVLLVVGGGVFFAGRRNLATLLFLLFCATTAVNDASQLPVLGGTSWAQRIMVAAYTLFSVQSPALGLHLFVLFPERRRIQRLLSLWLLPAYGIQTALGLAYFLPAYSTRIAERLADPAIHQTLLELFNTNVVICSALSAFSLASTAVRGRDERTRLQARLLFFAFLILTVLQLALYTVPLRLNARMLVSAEAYTLLDLIVPVFVAIAILFHRLFGIDVLIRQGFIYGAASVMVALFFVVVVFGLGWLGQRLGSQWELIGVAAAAATAGLLFPLVHRRTRWWVDRVLYRRRHSYSRLIDEISEQLGTVLDLDAAAMLLHTRIDRALQPRSLVVSCFQPLSETFESIHPDGGRRKALDGEDAAHLARKAIEKAGPFVPGSFLPEVALAVPLVHRQHLVGIVLLGERRSEVPYLSDDRRFLATIAHLAAAVFENARLLDERRVRERLATVGSATAAIAHEIKNPLAAIKSTAAILRRRIKDDPRGRELTLVVEEETERLQKSVLDVLAYVRPTTSEAVVFDLDELVGQLVNVVTPDFAGSGVTVEKNTIASSTTMVGDAEHIRQALLNLLMNAREAMPDGDTSALSCPLGARR